MPGRTRIPATISAEIRQALEDIWLQLERLSGPNNVDFHGRRIMNAGNAQADTDYTTLADVRNLILKFTGRGPRGAIIGAERGTIGGGGGSGGGGGGGGGGGCAGRDEPTVGFPDGFGIVESYAAANPGQLADSCIDDGGTWDFMDGVVAALQAVDERYGYNAQRGNPDDLSHDAVSYFYGNLGEMVVGSANCYVIDVIAGHCGEDPQPAFQDVTAPACGGWIPTR